MHALRYSVFKNQLDWDVKTRAGFERDEYDDHNPLYVTYVTDNEEVLGMSRTGPNMLNNTFADLMPAKRISDPFIWEASRFAVAKSARGQTKGRVGEIAARIIMAQNEYALSLGLSHIVGVFDMTLTRMSNTLHNDYSIIEGPVMVGETSTAVGLFPVTREKVMTIRANTGLGPQLFSDAELFADMAA